MEPGHIWIAWILIGIAIGWLAGRLTKGPGFSPSATIITAIAGAEAGMDRDADVVNMRVTQA